MVHTNPVFPELSDVIVKRIALLRYAKMKNRNRQRLNRRIKQEMLDLRDSCGVKDPTPYEAVKEMIKELRTDYEKKGSNISLYK